MWEQRWHIWAQMQFGEVQDLKIMWLHRCLSNRVLGETQLHQKLSTKLEKIMIKTLGRLTYHRLFTWITRFAWILLMKLSVQELFPLLSYKILSSNRLSLKCKTTPSIKRTSRLCYHRPKLIKSHRMTSHRPLWTRPKQLCNLDKWHRTITWTPRGWIRPRVKVNMQEETPSVIPINSKWWLKINMNRFLPSNNSPILTNSRR